MKSESHTGGVVVPPEQAKTPRGQDPRSHRRTLAYLACAFLLCIPAISPLLRAGLTCGYDNVFHLWRAVQIEHLIQQGILFSRWAPDMAHGFGFPLFVFHAPASAYVAALFHGAGLEWVGAINATFALGMVLGGIFAFLLARDLFGPAAGLVATVAYVYAPFQAYEAFNRGSLSEAFAWAFPPLVLWSVHRWVTLRDRRFLAVGAAGLCALILTHQLFAFLFAPLLIAWVLGASIAARDWHAVLRGAALGLLGLGLSAFFWLPGLTERGWVQTHRLLGTWVFDYRSNYLTLAELLSAPRTADPTLLNDWPPKALGLIPLLVALLPLLRWRWLSRAARWQTAVLLVLLLGFAMMTLPLSRPLWDHLPLLEYIQFPWRFLGPAVLCVSLLAAAAVSPVCGPAPPFANRILVVGSAVLIPLLALTGLGWFYPRHCSPPRDASVSGMIAWERATDTLGTTAKGEYLPIWVRAFPEEPQLESAYAGQAALDRLRREDLPSGAEILGANYGATDAAIELETPQQFQAVYLALYYPGWRVAIDGEAVPITITDPDGLISFDVPAGRHNIHVSFGETPFRVTADVVSLISLVLLLAILIWQIIPATWRRQDWASVRRRLPARRLVVAVIPAVTGLLLLAIVLDVLPALRGPEEWRWVYAVPAEPARLLLAGLTLTLYVLLVSVWIARDSRRGFSATRRWPYLVAIAVAVPAIQASLLALGYRDIFRPLFYRTVSAGGRGVFSVGSTIGDARKFLRNYPALMPTFPVHPQRYPPGLPLAFYVARRFVETLPSLADAVGFRLRMYLCDDLSFMRLPNATITTAAMQMALPVISGLTVFPLYGLAKNVYGPRIATWVVALFPLIPSFALWSGRWEQFFPLLVATSWYLLHLGLTRRRPLAMVASGAVLSIASFLNLSLVALLLPMGLFTVFWLLRQPREARSPRFWAAGLAAFVAGLASVWVVLEIGFGIGFADICRVAMSYHLGLGRDYATWLGYHLYDFFLFLGIPLAILFLYAFVTAAGGLLGHVTSRRQQVGEPHSHLWPPGSLASRSNIDALVLGFALGLLILDLSGTSRGEVARVWLFLTPIAALVAVRGLERTRLGQRAFVLVAILMAVQLLAFNACLRVVTTGVEPPPARSRDFDLQGTLSEVSHPLGAGFEVDGMQTIALLGYDVSTKSLQPGDTLHLTLYWQSLDPMTTPYTVFTHVVGEDNDVVGQRDNMPLLDAAPTTCWMPGEIIADPYQIEISPEALPGSYHLTTGFYILETGERLPAVGATATQDREVILTTIVIGDQ